MENEVIVKLTVDHLPDDNLWKELVGDNKPISPLDFLHKYFSLVGGNRHYIPYPSYLHPPR